VLLGGGRRLLQAWNARRFVARLSEPDVSPEEIEAVVPYGRAALPELFRLFGDAASTPLKHAAGRAIAALWAGDQLISEEEQALVRRGYSVNWVARRRYPRTIHAQIPIEVTYGLDFLAANGRGIRPENLEWSHRITGAGHAGLEEFSPWAPGRGHARFAVLPDDFDANGPHRLVLQSRVRTAGLTSQWQIELPHAPFQFEFDPRLEAASLLASPDDTRAEQIASTVRLEATPLDGEGNPRFLPLNDGLSLRNPPRLAVSLPLPCDLAHQLFLELEGIEGRFAAGTIVVSGQGARREREHDAAPAVDSYPLGPIASIPRELLDRPGRRAARVHLQADTDLGWTDPAVRSVWPGSITTNWIDVDILRR
jgi:hypothetical protein